jgi:MoaA/NifB/PqqE/SkfB family radical SAM enzyme/GT2 family glycosyltransferase
MQAGRISVIVPSYRSAHLDEVCAAVKGLDPVEILVVDSSPEKPAVADPEVTVVHVPQRLRPGAARNHGARQASGEYLLFVDSDVVLTDRGRAFVRTLVAVAADRVVSGVYAADGAGFFSRLQNRILRYRLTDGRDAAVPLFSSSHFLITRRRFRELGGFNEDIATYEDVEFLARAGQLGVQADCAADFEAVHRKAYSAGGLLEDYGRKAYNAFHVRRRYPRVFTAVPSMLGKDLARAWLSGLLWWLLPAAAALATGSLALAVATAVVLLLAPYPFSRRLARGEPAWATAVVLAYWPLMSGVIATAIAAAALAWTGHAVRGLVVRAADLLRALVRVVVRSGLPVQVIAYVTARCNLRCEHCFYKETLDAPGRGELPLEVFDRTTRGLGPVLWFSLAGGEPFVRKDLAQLIDVVHRHCRPQVFSFPTNGWYTEQTFETCLRVLQRMHTGNLILFFSLDGPRDMHDTIRGAGSFDRVKATMARLRPLTRLYPNLYLNVITTVTERNAEVAPAFIDELVRDFSPSAISINLFRYHSLEHPPLPARLIDGYKAAVDRYSTYLREGALRHYGFFGGRVLLFKEILQKDLIYRVAKFDEFVTPCTAGTLSYVIMEDGRVTPCEILPDSIGNVTSPLSVRDIVTGPEARRLRAWISDSHCKCTWECAMSTNTLFSWPMSKRMIRSLASDVVAG